MPLFFPAPFLPLPWSPPPCLQFGAEWLPLPHLLHAWYRESFLLHVNCPQGPWPETLHLPSLKSLQISIFGGAPSALAALVAARRLLRPGRVAGSSSSIGVPFMLRRLVGAASAAAALLCCPVYAVLPCSARLSAIGASPSKSCAIGTATRDPLAHQE